MPDRLHNILAMDIGGTRFRLGLFDSEGKLLLVRQDETSHSGGRAWMLDRLQTVAEELCRESTPPVEACGISFGGPVDFKRQTVTSVHTPGWRNFALSDWVNETLKLPCRVDNDANAGALGEYRFGAGRGAESLIYLTLSTGIGGGVITHGQLHRGRDSMAGEIGHLPLADSETACTCGLNTGCTEALSSGRTLGRKVREFAADHPEEAAGILALTGGNREKLTARELIAAAKQGDPAASRLFRESIRWLARALLISIRLLDPDKIVLGGGVSQAGDFLLRSLDDALREWWSPMFPYTTEIVLAERGDYAPLYGAAALALEL
ncbi:MAG TPA: ROK family protein [Terriglobia bacterium]|nr:ROK family protein [Terriglobia bacterium]